MVFFNLVESEVRLFTEIARERQDASLSLVTTLDVPDFTQQEKIARPVANNVEIAADGTILQRFAKAKGASSKFKPQRDLVKKTTEEEMDTSFSSDDKFMSQAVNHLSQVKNVKSFSNMVKTVALRMNEVDERVKPDSGADDNLMDEHQYKALLKRSEK